MRYYFHIQWRRFERWVRLIGVHPALMIAGSLVLFAGFCIMAYRKTDYAGWMMAGIAVMAYMGLGSPRKHNWLKVNFGRIKARRIRLYENLFTAVPFVIAACIYMDFWPAIVIAAATMPASRTVRPEIANRTIPTPFSRQPFEFPAGFRRTFPMIAGCFGLTAAAILADNSNLGIFSILAMYLTLMTYYGKAESKYFAWIFSVSSGEFLRTKIAIGLRYAYALTAVQVIVLSIAYPDIYHYFLFTTFIGSGYLVSAVLSKYAYYPSELPIAPALVIGLSILFPPLMVVTLPVLFRKANRQMKLVLP